MQDATSELLSNCRVGLLSQEITHPMLGVKREIMRSKENQWRRTVEFIFSSTLIRNCSLLRFKCMIASCIDLIDCEAALLRLILQWMEYRPTMLKI